jgi:two-component system CheB/CheR fusion protein
VRKAVHAPVSATFIVGIGASAGGLEATRPLLAALSPTGDTAYIIAQHMSPQHRSMLVEILSKDCKLKVVEASDNAELLADTVYIGPPNRDILVREGHIVLRKLGRDIGPKPSIDTLFTALADTYGEKALGIILSGTGSDGTHGSRAIRAAGGLVIAQTPKSAKYDGMPQSAIRADAVDLIMEPLEIAANLPDILNRIQSRRILDHSTGEDMRSYEDLMSEIYQSTKVDFSEYKRATLLRQIERRLVALQLSSFPDYLDYVSRHRDELNFLKKSFLISVTGFFRDADSFAQLKEVLQQRVDELAPQRRIRIWVPGCATGEEAYSMAMLLHDVLGERIGDYNINIFGTDIDAAATEIARKGVYSAAAVETLSAELLDSYFVRDGREYRVAKRVRDLCVFARHDLVSDPPFLRMNLISCRNLLIYFQSSLQDKIINNFHYALAPGGLLFLGNSESLSRARSGLFQALNDKHKIFQRKEGIKTRAIIGAFDPMLVRELDIRAQKPPLELKKTAVSECLLRAYAPPSVLINDDCQPLHFFGDTSQLLTIPEGIADFSLLSLVPEEIRTELRALLYRALNKPDSAPVEHPMVFQLNGISTAMRVVIRPLRVEETQENLRLVSFESLTRRSTEAAAAAESDGDSSSAMRIATLESELTSSREHLQAVIEELETSNEELQSLNEELQAATEELQSSNEELSTTNEELQASNEELTTLNDELRAKSDELGLLNSTLNNIQNSINMGLVVLDNQLRILRYTPKAVRVFGILPEDIGNRILGITCHVPIEHFEQTLTTVIRTRVPATLEVAGAVETYIINISPYLIGQQVGGVILTFSDITELTRARREALAVQSQFRLITDSLHEVVWMSSPAFDELYYISPAFHHYMGLPQQARVSDAKTYLDAIHPDDRQRFQDALGQSYWDIRYRLLTPSGRTLWLQDRGGRFRDDANDRDILIGSAIDITPSIDYSRQLQYSEEKFRTIFENSNIGIVLCNENGDILESNAFFCDWLGLKPDAINGKHFSSFVFADDIGKDADQYQDLLSGRINSYQTEQRYVAANGDILSGLLDVTTTEMAEADQPDPHPVVIKVVQDITEQVRSRHLIDRQANYDALTGLPNRNLLRDRLDELLKHARRSGETIFVLFIDLDGFKEINDSFGHDVGDQVLKAVAERLSDSVRESDTVARFGGDEFVVLLSNNESDFRAIDYVLHKLLTRVHEPIPVDDQSFILSASIGVATAPHDSNDGITLIRYADTAMYIAKKHGGNLFTFFSKDLNEQAQYRHDLKRDLQTALHNDQLTLHFQPIIEPHDNLLSHCEALLRWQHPVKGVIMPGTFIPIAEETSLIEEIDLWVFEHVADFLDRTPDFPARISFNMTPRTLMSERLQQLIEQHAEQLGRMVVEITELFHKYPEALTQPLRTLRRLGCLISLDDFGTGYSNLSRIRNHPIDIIKLDKSFTDSVEHSHDKYPIIEAVFNIAESIGSKVIVEGVESEEQKLYFEQFSDVFIQGYYYSKPLPENRFLEYARQPL